MHDGELYQMRGLGPDIQFCSGLEDALNTLCTEGFGRVDEPDAACWKAFVEKAMGMVDNIEYIYEDVVCVFSTTSLRVKMQ